MIHDVLNLSEFSYMVVKLYHLLLFRIVISAQLKHLDQDQVKGISSLHNGRKVEQVIGKSVW